MVCLEPCSETFLSHLFNFQIVPDQKLEVKKADVLPSACITRSRYYKQNNDPEEPESPASPSFTGIWCNPEKRSSESQTGEKNQIQLRFG